MKSGVCPGDMLRGVRKHRSLFLGRSPLSQGFTILELLVCVAVIGVLLAILLPTLAQSRETALKLSLLSNQRESAAMVLAYTNDNQGLFPAFGMERTMVAMLEWKGEIVEAHWWGQLEYWGLFLQTRGYDGWVSMGPTADASIFERISCGSCGQGRSAHLFMAAAFAEPDQFTSQREDDSRLHIVQRVESVTSPALKGMLLHVRSIPDGRPPVAFVDGHGSWEEFAALNPGVDAQLPYTPLPVVQTVNGVLGRDR